VIVGAVRDSGGVIAEDGLTKTERQLIDAAMAGEPVTCADDGRHVRAEVIRDLLVGRHGEPDPRGLRLLDAEITGQLDVDGLLLDDGVVAEGHPTRAGGVIARRSSCSTASRTRR